MSSHSAPRPRSATRPLATAVLVGLVLAAGVAVALSWPGRSSGVAPTAPSASSASSAPSETSGAARPTRARALLAPRGEVRAARVLQAWDRRREAVWASGGQADLAALYVRGSAAGRRDVAMLASWQARGLRVEGLRTQVLALQVLARRPGRLEVQVVDRVAAGVAVGPGVRRPLPRDAPSTRRVVLVDGPTGWRVARVSAGPRPAPP